MHNVFGVKITCTRTLLTLFKLEGGGGRELCPSTGVPKRFVVSKLNFLTFSIIMQGIIKNGFQSTVWHCHGIIFVKERLAKCFF